MQKFKINFQLSTLIAILFLFLTGACSSAGGGNSTCAASPDGLLSLECAAKLLIDEGFPNRAESENGHFFQWPFPLSPGDQLAEGIPDEEEEDPTRRIILEEESWFFFADLDPGAMWNHPTQFILVSRASGKVTTYTRNSYPMINNLALFVTSEEREVADVRIPGFAYPQSAKMQVASEFMEESKVAMLSFAEPTPVDRHVPGPIPPEDPRAKEFPNMDGETEAEYEARLRGAWEGLQTEAETDAEMGKCPTPECEVAPGKFALLIDGGRVEGGNQKYGKQLRERGYNTRILSPEASELKDHHGSATDFPTDLSAIEAAFDWLAANASSCCDEVVIVISAHGSQSGLLEINPEQMVRDRESPDPKATKKIGRKDGGFLSSARLQKYLNKIKSCRVKIFINSCYSGKHLDLGINRIPPDFTGCMCRVIAASSSSRQTSGIGGATTFLEEFIRSNSFEEAFKIYKKLWSIYPNRKDRYLMTPLVQATDCALCLDGDEDGIISGLELEKNYSDPERADTDGDGLCDSCEKTYETDPRSSDSDKDGIPDGEEIERETNPLDADSDDDGLSDRYEKIAETDPLNPDTDGDGLSDGEEALERRTLPTHPDTDGDGKSVGDEVK